MTDLIIVGLDPGTTVAYAILDIEGGVVETYSAKELPLSEVIERVIKKGKPLIAASDVSSTPTFVDKFATKTGSKVISPETDLLVKEKEALTKRYDVKNTHEMDALASALYAYKIISPMIERIKDKLKEMNKSDLMKEVLELVIKHSLSIKDAVKMLEEPEKQESQIIKKVAEKRILLESDYMELYKKLKRAEQDMKLLRHHSDSLKKGNDILRRKNEFLMQKITSVIPKEKTRDLLYFKNKTINSLALEKDEKLLDIKILNHKLLNLNRLLLDMGNKTLLKKLHRLSREELDKKAKILCIKKGDILLVEDLTVFSPGLVDELKSRVSIIIYKNSSKKVIEKLPFTCLDAKNLSLVEDDYVALVKNDLLEKELGKQDIITRVIKEYQEERMS